jgi:Retroviral aspartyl protease
MQFTPFTRGNDGRRNNRSRGTRTTSIRPQQIFCNTCGQPGQISRYCTLSDWSSQQPVYQQVTNAPYQSANTQLVCNQPQPLPLPPAAAIVYTQQQAAPQFNARQATFNSDTSDNTSTERPNVKLRIANKTHMALLDSGAQVTILPVSCVQGLEITPVAIEVLSASNNETKILGSVSFTAFIENIPVIVNGYVSNQTKLQKLCLVSHSYLRTTLNATMANV